MASEIDPSAEVEPPQVVVEVEEPSSAGGSPEEAPTEVETEPADGEEEGECGFCIYMKGGGCKEAFESWEECVQAAEKDGSDMVQRCSQATADLKKCMDAHADYYAPVLRAEHTVSDQAQAAIAAATADTNKNKGEEDETKVEGAVVKPAATAADEVVVVEQATSSTAAKEEEAIVHKAESLSLGN